MNPFPPPDFRRVAAMLWKTATADHIGGRSEQQDRAAAFANPAQARHLLVLADGMGGHQGGALAAQSVVDTARQLWQQYGSGDLIADPPAFLSRLCHTAHDVINQVGQRHNLMPHSTCIALYLQDNRAWWTHVGDSRLYHFRQSELINRTKDHSLVQMLVDMGKAREDEMATHQDQNCLLRGLGGQEPPEPEFASAPTEAGDVFLMCSDGLWERLSPPEMRDPLRPDSLAAAATHLVELAARRGGQRSDNVSVALAYRLA
jgi:serine/threonine protein phosphatase PrpC